MLAIEYHHSNFPQVTKLLRQSRIDFKTGVHGRVMFNKTKQQFEYYEPKETKDHSKTDEYIHVDEAIAMYEENRKVREAALQQVGQSLDDGDNAVAMDDDTVDKIDEASDLLESDAPSFPEIDDPELFASTNSNLKVLTALKDKQSDEIREKLLQVISNIYGYDMITESDIALAIVENSELKKILSMLFSKLGVKVSSTRVSADLKVSSGELTFVPKIENGLEDYRRGAAQCLVDVNRLAEAKDQLEEKDRSIREATRELADERRKNAELSTAVDTLRTERDAVRELKPVEPIEYTIGYKTDKGTRYIYPTKDRKLDDGTFPTKYLSSTSRKQKAYNFTLDAAISQVNRLVKFSKNVKFVEIADKGTKELSQFFSIHRTLVEKVEVIKNEQGS